MNVLPLFKHRAQSKHFALRLVLIVFTGFPKGDHELSRPVFSYGYRHYRLVFRIIILYTEKPHEKFREPLRFCEIKIKFVGFIALFQSVIAICDRIGKIITKFDIVKSVPALSGDLQSSVFRNK